MRLYRGWRRSRSLGEFAHRPRRVARLAVIRHSGTWSAANYNEHLRQLQQAVAAAVLCTTGTPIYSRYNAPFVPRFLCRNEIWLKVD